MTTASCASGDVTGAELPTGILEFLGIPFAAPPVGKLRFEPPVPHSPWPEPWDATKYGPTAPQPQGEGPMNEILPNRIAPGDEYLNLNVWTPTLDGAAPVMVFIHGGGFSTGSGSVSVYNGERFARDGVVLVTINYRLGPDGFLWVGDGVANLGLLDQIAALEWVRDNIAAFGGDPQQVTLFGESAGAMSVVSLMAMPRAQGLFHRAIAESGAGVSVISPRSAKKVAARLAALLGIRPTRSAISALPVDRVLAGASTVGEELTKRPFTTLWGEAGRNLMAFEPVVDGDILPGIPEDLIAAGAGHDIDLLIGTNSDEANLFFVPSGAVDRMPSIIASVFAWLYGARRPGTVRRYRRNRPGVSAGTLAAAILTDGFYRIPALRLAGLHPHAHVYEFAWKSGAFDGRLGACHAMELPFVFDTLDDPEAAAMLGGPAPQELATRMHAAWVRFAKTGDPGWPPFTAEQRTSMRFDVTSHLTEDERADERALWPSSRRKARIRA
ncbi:carboxylesterase/lipase family protein [Frondihabitans cladoniiphilus]|uniref:Carboxylic ester hydrolase n=1 Tax=Frondihabitans cladoniiphilus TaxID=715785 RepID=A0ABP8VMK2_9MICO